MAQSFFRFFLDFLETFRRLPLWYYSITKISRKITLHFELSASYAAESFAKSAVLFVESHGFLRLMQQKVTTFHI